MSKASRGLESGYFSTLVGAEAAMRLFRRAGLMAAGEAAPEVIDMVTFWRLCAENIQASNDESHGVAAEPVPLGSLSMLFTAAKEADDLAGALERLAAAARLIRKECRIAVGRGRDTVRLTVTPTPPGGPRAEIYVECFIIVAHCALRWMTGRRLDPVSVRGSAALRGFAGSVLLAPGAPVVRRGEGATIVYRAEDMRAPILEQKYGFWGEAEFESFAELLHQEEEPIGAQSPDILAVVQALRAGVRSQGEIAASMGISRPTLRRRLAEHGVSFRRISADVRQAELRELLATDLPVQAVAERLGLSDDRSLRRFCSAQLGVSPRQYRRLGA